MAAPEPKKPGLKSIHELREQRQRGKFSRATPNFWLFVAGAILAILLGYRFFATRKLDEDKNALLAKQRAVQKTVGAEWEPLRDKIEKFTIEAAGPWPGDWKDSSAGTWDFRSVPGVYLRLRVDEAKDVARLRKAAQGSLRDGFVGCFLREPNQAGAQGIVDGGVFPEQPWNMRQGYTATRILTDDWVNEVKDSADDLRLRVFEQQYKQATEHDILLAIDLIKKAQFFLLVLDEDAAEAAKLADGGAITSETLQLVPHDARVLALNLRTGNAIARYRMRASGSAVSAAGRVSDDPEVRDAVQRQVNNCSLANQVSDAMGLPR
jgi:hypothetical protein